MQEIAVIGAGSWGTALAIVLADNGYRVRLWARREEQVKEINEHRTNEHYLPKTTIPDSITAYSNLSEAIQGISTILLVVPTKAIREVVREINQSLTKKTLFIHASKGIELETYKRISEMIEEEVDPDKKEAVVVLSGPSHAEEVVKRQPTSVAVSSLDSQAAEFVQDLFINQYFRVYTNSDLIGVEMGGALKNIIALGAGLTNGLGYGDNAKAALMTRGLAEMTRLGTKLGADPLTFAGLSGLGDLIVTCTSIHSRNYRAGNMIGQGHSVDEVLTNMGMVVEGIRTTEAVYNLAKKVNVEMPITNQLYAVLFENKDPKQAVHELMGREGKQEAWN